MATSAVADTGWTSGINVGVGASATTGLNLSVGYYDGAGDSYWRRHIGARIDFATTDPLTFKACVLALLVLSSGLMNWNICEGDFKQKHK